jgi:hypothetical protein
MCFLWSNRNAVTAYEHNEYIEYIEYVYLLGQARSALLDD